MIQTSFEASCADWLSRRLATVLAEIPASESDLTARVVGANPHTVQPWSSANSRIAPTVVVFAAPARPSIEVIQSVDVRVSSATGECHHLFARVAVKLPSPVLSRDLDFVSEPLTLASQLGTIDGGGKVLRTIDLDWIEAAPLPVRATGHVGDYYMRVKMRVGAVAVLDAACGPRGDMIEAGS